MNCLSKFKRKKNGRGTKACPDWRGELVRRTRSTGNARSAACHILKGFLLCRSRGNDCRRRPRNDDLEVHNGRCVGSLSIVQSEEMLTINCLVRGDQQARPTTDSISDGSGYILSMAATGVPGGDTVHNTLKLKVLTMPGSFRWRALSLRSSSSRAAKSL